MRRRTTESGQMGQDMVRVVVWYALLLAICPRAHSFELDGLKSGMAYEEVKAVLESQSYEHIQYKGNNIIATDTKPQPHGRLISLNFCKSLLVSMQKHLIPRFEIFVSLVYEKRRELGRPLDAWTRPPDFTSSVESNSISFIWRAANDFTSITFTQFQSNNQLDITLDVQNDCYPVPY
jgi:hypothetical protein